MKPCIFLPQPSNFLLKKILIVTKKKAFSYISENGTLHFSAQAQRIKNSTRRTFLAF